MVVAYFRLGATGSLFEFVKLVGREDTSTGTTSVFPCPVVIYREQDTLLFWIIPKTERETRSSTNSSSGEEAQCSWTCEYGLITLFEDLLAWECFVAIRLFTLSGEAIFFPFEQDRPAEDFVMVDFLTKRY